MPVSPLGNIIYVNQNMNVAASVQNMQFNRYDVQNAFAQAMANEKEMKVEELLENDDTLFLMKVKDRLVVLFEGLQDKNIVDLDSKLQMTLDFLEYLLADIEDRLKDKSSE